MGQSSIDRLCCCRGDQHDPRYFDYFAENNLIHHFAKFLEQKGNRRGDVAKQVLQTLSILIQNIRSTTAIFYLFSNNVVNEIVAMRFDFEDDEVLGYFINLLKTISLKALLPAETPRLRGCAGVLLSACPVIINPSCKASAQRTTQMLGLPKGDGCQEETAGLTRAMACASSMTAGGPGQHACKHLALYAQSWH